MKRLLMQIVIQVIVRKADKNSILALVVVLLPTLFFLLEPYIVTGK